MLATLPLTRGEGSMPPVLVCPAGTVLWDAGKMLDYLVEVRLIVGSV